MRAAERAAVAEVAEHMRLLAKDIDAHTAGSAHRSELQRLRDMNRRLLAALKSLDAAAQSHCPKEKALAHYAAIALISEIEAGQ